MRIWTSYFGNTKLPSGLPKISIAGGPPTGWREGGNLEYRRLAPKYDWWRQWHEQKLSVSWYIERYNSTVLSKLNVPDVVSELVALAGGSDELCLLCYEKPSESWFCHRQLVRGWINDYYRSQMVRGWISYEWKENFKNGEKPSFIQMELL